MAFWGLVVCSDGYVRVGLAGIGDLHSLEETAEGRVVVVRSVMLLAAVLLIRRSVGLVGIYQSSDVCNTVASSKRWVRPRRMLNPILHKD